MVTESARFCIVLGQRASWPEMLARTRETEELGFDGLFLVDHFFGLKDVSDPTHDAYTMLAALAPFTQRIRLGIMVCGNTYRHPALLLKQAMTVDHISNGRVDFGVGAGWLEREHEAYGVPFPTAGERVDRFAEALQIWDLLQRQERTTFEGKHYRLIDAPFEPKSLQSPRLPLLVGATGKRMLRLTVRHADMWNTVGTPQEAGETNRLLDQLCIDAGRDPASLVRAVSPSINLLASVEAFVEGVAAYREAGFRDIYMPWPRTEAEVPILREVARNVLPGLRDGGPGEAPNQPAKTILRAITAGDTPTIATILTELEDAPRKVMHYLIAHPDERLEGAQLREILGFETHAEVSLAIATAGDAFAGQGLHRPWTEAQRGYQLDTERAALLDQARNL